MFHRLKKLSRDVEDIKRSKLNEPLKTKTTKSKLKNTLDRINGRLDIREEMITKLKLEIEQ